jgi:hypothetical protein
MTLLATRATLMDRGIAQWTAECSSTSAISEAAGHVERGVDAYFEFDLTAAERGEPR